MKKILSLLAVFGLAIAGFTACQETPENNTDIPSGEMRAVTITAAAFPELSSEADTRVVLDQFVGGEYKSKWEVGDKMGMIIYKNDYTDNGVYKFEIKEGGIDANGVATFSGSIPYTMTGNLFFYPIYPYEANVHDAGKIIATVPYEQTMKGLSYDPQAIKITEKVGRAGIAASIADTSSPINISCEDTTFEFRTSAILLKLKTDDAMDSGISMGDKVLAVEYEAESPFTYKLTGAFSTSLRGISPFAAFGEPEATSNKVKVYTDPAENYTIQSLIDNGVWMVVAGSQYINTGNHRVKVYTENYTITKIIPSFAGNFNFNKNTVKLFNMALDANAIVTPNAPAEEWWTAKFDYTESAYLASSTDEGAIINSVTSTEEDFEWYISDTAGATTTADLGDGKFTKDAGEALSLGESGTIISQRIVNGISKLKFDYIGNGKNFKVEVFLGQPYGTPIWSSTTKADGTTALNASSTFASSGTYELTDVPANAVIKFTNTSGSRRAVIGNISWVESTGIIGSTTGLAQPTGLASTDVFPTWFTVTWNAVANNSGYAVSIDGGLTWSAAQSETEFTAEGLIEQTDYNVQVKALGNTVTTSDSPVASLTVTTIEDTGEIMVGDVLWAETWSGGKTTHVPSTYLADSSSTGTTVYDDATITYAESATNSNLYNEKSAGGTAPELLLRSGSTTWTITGIPVEGAKTASFSMKANNTTRTKVEYFFDGSATAAGSFTGVAGIIDNSTANASTMNIVITNTTSSNVRLDDIEVKVTEVF